MKCPKCGSAKSQVVDTRIVESLDHRRRRRECLVCGARFTTYEISERDANLVRVITQLLRVFNVDPTLLDRIQELACANGRARPTT